MFREEGYKLSAIIADHLKNNIPQMIKLDLSRIDLASRNFRTICLALQQNSTVTSLDLWDTPIDEESAQDLRDVLLQNNTIRNLKLGDSKLSDIGLLYCCEGLRASKSLKELKIGNFEKVTETGWNFFLRSMNENKIIQKLDIQSISFSDCKSNTFDFLKNGNISDFSVRFSSLNYTSIYELATSLKESSNLTRFRFEAPGSGDSTPVVDSLRYCPDLETVEFYNFLFSLVGSDLLRKLVMNAKNLKSISLTKCRDSDNQTSFVKNLFKALESNTSITALDLTRSHGECDFSQVFAAIEKNTTLKRLDMQYLDIESEAQFISGISGIIEKNQTLEDLSIEVEAIGSDRTDLSELLKSIKFNKSLTKLNLQGWEMKKETVPIICDSLKMNNSLKTLDLSFNSFGDDICNGLAEVFVNNETLTSLDLSSNIMSNVGFKKMVDIMKHTTTLVLLQLEDESSDDVVGKEMDECTAILNNLMMKNQSFQETNKKIAKTFGGHKIGKFFADISVIFQETPKKKTISR